MADEHLRASDDEREALVDALRGHAAAGRLTTEELEERTGAAYGAGGRARPADRPRRVSATARSRGQAARDSGNGPLIRVRADVILGDLKVDVATPAERLRAALGR